MIGPLNLATQYTISSASKGFRGETESISSPMLSELPRDLAEEVLIRLPVTSNRAVRSVCKKWNTISKGRSFTKKHLARAKAAAARESMVVMRINQRLYLMSINLHKGGVDPCINRLGKLISLADSGGGGVDIYQVYHCDGLLLCVTIDEPRLVVWNPYTGQTRWFKLLPDSSGIRRYNYAIGYDEISSKSRRKYKVLRFGLTSHENVRCEIYYINPSKDDITMPITINPDWDIEFYARGASLNGNTYWFAQQLLPHPVDISEVPDFLICYDFTTERFGQPLSLPFHSYAEDTVSLSSVRDEQLAVLYQDQFTLRMEIWITTKIDPQVVSWSKFYMLAVDMEPLIGQHQFDVTFASFFVDEEKKVAVVLDIFGLNGLHTGSSLERVAYIVGEDGYFKKEDLIGGGSSTMYHGPHVCSFIPSLAQIKRGRKRKKTHTVKYPS